VKNADEQVEILNEAWELVSQANRLLGQPGLFDAIYATQKRVLDALNDINHTRTLVSSARSSDLEHS
jgi:hypothetical protein